MAGIIKDRMTAAIDGDFVVFLIGMRINTPWKVWKWLPISQSMPRMLAELQRDPALGLLHSRSHFGLRNAMLVQYWRSFDHLHAYATGKTHAHVPAWQTYVKTLAGTGDIGIWHETYLVRAGEYECVYAGMPPYGLGQAGDLVPATGRRQDARGRLGLTS